MEQAIGGYFELELRKGGHFHRDALCLNTARNCFEYILRARGYKTVYIPYYTCEVMLEPLNKLSIGYKFYHINLDLEPVGMPILKEGEAFLYTNYFGLKQKCVEQLAAIYENRLIVDNAQAFFAKALIGIDTFYSARKFFGVADGAYLYTDCHLDINFEQDYSYDRMSHLLKRIDLSAEEGYDDYHKAEDSLCNQPIKKMSKITEAILRSIDYKEISAIRRNTFMYLDSVLRSNNGIHLSIDEDTVPMVYPYLTSDLSLRNRLIEHRVFVATYWPNVASWCDDMQIEFSLSGKLIPLPINRKYAYFELMQ